MELRVSSSVKKGFSEQALGLILQHLLSIGAFASSPALSTQTSSSPIGSPNTPPVIWVAYSGGLDSHVLLTAVANLFKSSIFDNTSVVLQAVHINHGLSANANVWQSHCESICDALNVPLTVRKVEIGSCGSVETLAREARYQVFNEIVSVNDHLLMAHHQDDQLETMLFRLLRGAGVKGLSGIPAHRELKQGRLLRPLLKFSRVDLQQYADDNHLVWVQDESNLDKNYDRNFLRHDIFPLLKQRWPGLADNWQRTAQLCDEADYLQNVLAKQDFELVQTKHEYRLDINALKKLELIRQRNVLRYWLQKLTAKYSFPAPGFHCLQRIISEVLPAAIDANPLVTWFDGEVGVEIRRFAGHLYAIKSGIQELELKPVTWNQEQNILLPGFLGKLSMTAVTSKGVDISAINNLRIAFRQGGEQVKPAGRRTRSLKKVLQDYQVPPWLRDRVPLIYDGDKLVAVADLFICEQCQVEDGHNLYRFCWEKSDIHCGF